MYIQITLKFKILKIKLKRGKKTYLINTKILQKLKLKTTR